MSEKKFDVDTLNAELDLLRVSLIEIRTNVAADVGRKSRSSVRRRIARLLGLRSSIVFVG